MPPPRFTSMFTKPGPLLRQPTRQRVQQRLSSSSSSSSTTPTPTTPTPAPLKNPDPFPGGILVGPADNAFNRERAAVKIHAEASAGKFCASATRFPYNKDLPPFQYPLSNTPYPLPHPSYNTNPTNSLLCTTDFWRKLSIYVVPPAIVWAVINAWNLWNDHWEHWAHRPALEDRPQYSYQNIRTKNFPWGDGDKTLL